MILTPQTLFPSTTRLAAARVTLHKHSLAEEEMNCATKDHVALRQSADIVLVLNTPKGLTVSARPVRSAV